MSRDPALLAHLRELQHHLILLEQEINGSTGPIEQAQVVQLKPSADPAYGGLLMRVTQRTPYEIRGYLLLPRRGGSRETWTRLAPHDVTPIGRIVYPEAEYGFAPYAHCNPEAEAISAAVEAEIQKFWGRKRRKPPQQETRDDDHRRINCGGDR